MVDVFKVEFMVPTALVRFIILVYKSKSRSTIKGPEHVINHGSTLTLALLDTDTVIDNLAEIL